MLNLILPAGVDTHVNITSDVRRVVVSGKRLAVDVMNIRRRRALFPRGLRRNPFRHFRRQCLQRLVVGRSRLLDEIRDIVSGLVVDNVIDTRLTTGSGWLFALRQRLCGFGTLCTLLSRLVRAFFNLRPSPTSRLQQVMRCVVLGLHTGGVAWLIGV